jgi:SAM-dependent methyltransferase
MADHKEIYTQAMYYDIIFDRDVSSELNFALDMYCEENGGRAARSLIDIACGPGYYAIQGAQRGLKTYGLDLRREMVELGAQKAEQHGVKVTWLAEDMRSFTLTPPVDVALTMFDSLDVLSTDEDLIAHFQAMYRNLTPGGIYVIELSHPRDASYGAYGDYLYTGERDGIQVRMKFDVNGDWDLLTGLINATAHFYVTHPDGASEHYVSCAQERLYLPRELNPLVKLAGGFRNIGWYGAFRRNQPLDYSGMAVRQVAVYQRL